MKEILMGGGAKMANNQSLQILRGSGHSSSTVLLDGQPYYDKKNNLLFVGDGRRTIAELLPVNTLYLHAISFGDIKYSKTGTGYGDIPEGTLKYFSFCIINNSSTIITNVNELIEQFEKMLTNSAKIYHQDYTQWRVVISLLGGSGTFAITGDSTSSNYPVIGGDVQIVSEDKIYDDNNPLVFKELDASILTNLGGGYGNNKLPKNMSYGINFSKDKLLELNPFIYDTVVPLL